MRKHLFQRFIYLYIVIGIISFFITTIVGSILIERYLTRVISTNLNLEALSIGENPNLIDSIVHGEKDEAEANLRTIANYENCTMWILDADKNLLITTDENYDLQLPDEFSPADWALDAYVIGDFYHLFKEPRLSVIDKIHLTDQVDGYVVIHYQMKKLYERRAGALRITQIVFAILYMATSALLRLCYSRVHKPLQEITHGASEFASGNLFYKIQIDGEDELAYLSHTLNYMAERLSENNKYTREFVSNVSHDFRSPLTSIKGYAEAMQDGTIPPEFYGRYLNIIVSETERLEKLTLSLRALNDLDTYQKVLNMDIFDINQTIRSVAATFEGICYDKKLTLNLAIPNSELLTYADKEQIQQVLYNLIDNAIKFSKPHSQIILSTSTRSGRIFVSIKDFGIGIPKENLPNIWKRFYKADTSRGKDRSGTGLGLSIVREIIRAHNQQIDVISTEGEGTEFIFTLEKRS